MLSKIFGTAFLLGTAVAGSLGMLYAKPHIFLCYRSDANCFECIQILPGPCRPMFSLLDVTGAAQLPFAVRDADEVWDADGESICLLSDSPVGESLCGQDQCGDGACCVTSNKYYCCPGSCPSAKAEVVIPPPPVAVVNSCVWRGTAPFCDGECNSSTSRHSPYAACICFIVNS